MNSTRPPQSTAPDSGSPYALNDKLRNVGAVGLRVIEGAEDMILDRDDNLYCGNRHGDIMRFFGPDHTKHEIFAHVGGQPLDLLASFHLKRLLNGEKGTRIAMD